MAVIHEAPRFRGTTDERQIQVEKFIRRLCEELNMSNTEYEGRLLNLQKTGNTSADLLAYATKDDISELEAKIEVGAGTIDLSVYAKKKELSGFATKKELSSIKITKDQIDMSVFDGYVTEGYMEEKIANIEITEDKINLSAYAKKEDLKGINDKIAEITIENDSIIQKVKETTNGLEEVKGSLALEIVEENGKKISQLRSDVDKIRFSADKFIVNSEWYSTAINGRRVYFDITQYSMGYSYKEKVVSDTLFDYGSSTLDENGYKCMYYKEWNLETGNYKSRDKLEIHDGTIFFSRDNSDSPLIKFNGDHLFYDNETGYISCSGKGLTGWLKVINSTGSTIQACMLGFKNGILIGALTDSYSMDKTRNELGEVLKDNDNNEIEWD